MPDKTYDNSQPTAFKVTDKRRAAD